MTENGVQDPYIIIINLLYITHINYTTMSEIKNMPCKRKPKAWTQ